MAKLPLYFNFDDKNEETYDSDDTDWTDFSKDVSLKRKGIAKEMFNPDIIEKLSKLANPIVRQLFAKFGPYKIKISDIPPSLNNSILEVRYELV